MEHTKGNWKKGINGSIVSDSMEGLAVESIEDHVKYYGGHCICESISDANADYILACVDACKEIRIEALRAGYISGMINALDEIAKSYADEKGLKIKSKDSVFYRGVKVWEEKE